MHVAFTTLATFFFGAVVDSPFIVPVAGCAMILGIVLAGVWSGNRKEELRSRERLECIARGITPPPTMEEVAAMHQSKGPAMGSLAKRRANIRLAGIILVASAIGIALFFFALTVILRQREIMAGAATAIIPLAIGVAFLIDTKTQTKEIEEAHASSSGLEPLK